MDDSEKKDMEWFENALENMPEDVFVAKFEGSRKSPPNKRKISDDTPFDREIDLHGFTCEEALTVLRTALTHAKGKRQKLLVITGKGKNSSDGRGAIHDSVLRFLGREGSRLVREYRFADRKNGGDGAFEIITK